MAARKLILSLLMACCPAAYGADAVWGNFSDARIEGSGTDVVIVFTSTATTTLVPGLVHQWTFETDDASDEIGDLDLAIDGASHATDHFDFDGVNDEIKAGVTSSFITGSSNWSVSVWAYKHASSVFHTIFAQSDGTTRFWLGMPSSAQTHISAARYDGSYTVMETDNAVPLNDWTHFVMTHTDTGEVGLYMNGTNQTDDVASGPSTSATVGFNLGSRTDEWPPSQFDGLIDTVHVSSEVLSASDVLVLYEAGGR